MATLASNVDRSSKAFERLSGLLGRYPQAAAAVVSATARIGVSLIDVGKSTPNDTIEKHIALINKLTSEQKKSVTSAANIANTRKRIAKLEDDEILRKIKSTDRLRELRSEVSKYQSWLKGVGEGAPKYNQGVDKLKESIRNLTQARIADKREALQHRNALRDLNEKLRNFKALEATRSKTKTQLSGLKSELTNLQKLESATLANRRAMLRWSIGIGIAAGALAGLAAGMSLVTRRGIMFYSILEDSQLQLQFLAKRAYDTRYGIHQFNKSIEFATGNMVNLKMLARESPLDLRGVVVGTTVLENFGGSLLNNQRFLEKFIDTVSILKVSIGASADGVREVARQIGQMFSNLRAGRAFGQDARILTQRGVMSPATWQELNDLLKHIQDEGLGGTEEAAVMAAEAIERMLEGLEGGAKAASETISGLREKFIETFDAASASVLETTGVIDLLKAGLQSAIDIMETFEPSSVMQVFMGLARASNETFSPQFAIANLDNAMYALNLYQKERWQFSEREHENWNEIQHILSTFRPDLSEGQLETVMLANRDAAKLFADQMSRILESTGDTNSALTKLKEKIDNLYDSALSRMRRNAAEAQALIDAARNAGMQEPAGQRGTRDVATGFIGVLTGMKESETYTDLDRTAGRIDAIMSRYSALVNVIKQSQSEASQSNKQLIEDLWQTLLTYSEQVQDSYREELKVYTESQEAIRENASRTAQARSDAAREFIEEMRERSHHRPFDRDAWVKAQEAFSEAKLRAAESIFRSMEGDAARIAVSFYDAYQHVSDLEQKAELAGEHLVKGAGILAGAGAAFSQLGALVPGVQGSAISGLGSILSALSTGSPVVLGLASVATAADILTTAMSDNTRKQEMFIKALDNAHSTLGLVTTEDYRQLQNVGATWFGGHIADQEGNLTYTQGLPEEHKKLGLFSFGEFLEEFERRGGDLSWFGDSAYKVLDAYRMSLSLIEDIRKEEERRIKIIKDIAAETIKEAQSIRGELTQSYNKMSSVLEQMSEAADSAFNVDALHKAIDGMHELGLLTEDVRDAYHALADAVHINWREMIRLTEAFDIGQGQLGSGFIQAKVTGLGGELANAFKMLTDTGGDRLTAAIGLLQPALGDREPGQIYEGGLASVIRDALSTQAHDIETLLPRELQPVIEALLTAGVDFQFATQEQLKSLQFGDPLGDTRNKLHDLLSDINTTIHEAAIAEADAVITSIEDLRDKEIENVRWQTSLLIESIEKGNFPFEQLEQWLGPDSSWVTSAEGSFSELQKLYLLLKDVGISTHFDLLGPDGKPIDFTFDYDKFRELFGGELAKLTPNPDQWADLVDLLNNKWGLKPEDIAALADAWRLGLDVLIGPDGFLNINAEPILGLYDLLEESNRLLAVLDASLHFTQGLTRERLTVIAEMASAIDASLHFTQGLTRERLTVIAETTSAIDASLHFTQGLTRERLTVIAEMASAINASLHFTQGLTRERLTVIAEMASAIDASLHFTQGLTRERLTVIAETTSAIDASLHFTQGLTRERLTAIKASVDATNDTISRINFKPQIIINPPTINITNRIENDVNTLVDNIIDKLPDASNARGL